MIRSFPVVRALRRWRYGLRFVGRYGVGCCHGRLATRAEALAAAAAAAAAAGGHRLGYDHAAAADMYDGLLHTVQARDYPVLFWLRGLVGEATSIFDLGGHIGLTYYACRRVLDLPPALRWTVCDVPAVVARGAALARARGDTALHFVADPAQASGADVLLASGVLQYLEEPCDAILRRLEAPPRHVLVNMLPTCERGEFWTVQNIGVSFCAYRVARTGALVEQVAPLGYDLVDQWEEPSRTFRLPMYEQDGPIVYRGYYLRRSVV